MIHIKFKRQMMQYSIKYPNGGVYLLIVLLIFLIYYLTHQQREETFLSEPEEFLNDNIDENQSSYLERINKNEGIDECLIVIWTNFFGTTEWFTEIAFSLEWDGTSCPSTNCIFSLDRNKVSNAAAVLFHGVDFDIYDIPSSRTPEQIYIWFDLEAPATHHIKGVSHILPLLKEDGAGSKGFFNWTFTYHSLSDVTVPYGYVVPNQVGTVTKDSRESSTKAKKLVAWIVSHCNTDSGREKYVLELSKYIPISICGKCNDEPCPDEAMQLVAENYYFYLAFENNRCKDYITEKVWRSLKAGVIPVVYGGADYTRYLPPESFIDAGKLTPRQLAQLLRRLSKNSSELAKYHEWRAKFDIDLRPTWCPLCKRLQQHRERKEPHRVIKNLPYWWVNVNRCHSDYPLESGIFEMRMEDLLKQLQ